MKKAVWCDETLVVTGFKFGLCVTEKQYEKELKRLKIPRKEWSPYMKTSSCGATVQRFYGVTDGVNDGDSAALVCLKENHGCTLNQVHALLVHEAMHLWRDVRELIGEDEPSKEFEAYAMQAICQRLFYAYDALTKKRKR